MLAAAWGGESGSPVSSHTSWPPLPGLACCPSLWARVPGQVRDFGRPAARRPLLTGKCPAQKCRCKCGCSVVRCACTCTCTGGLLRRPKSCTRSKSASSSGPPKFPINRPPPTLACRFRFPLLSLSSSKPPGFPGHFHPPRTEAIIIRASDQRHHHTSCTLHLAHHSTAPAPALSIHHQTTTLQPTRCSPQPDQLPKPPNHQNHHSKNGAP